MARQTTDSYPFFTGELAWSNQFFASEEYNEFNWVGQSKQARQTRVVTHNFFLFVLFIIPLVLPKSLKAMTCMILVTMRQKTISFHIHYSK